MCLQTFSSQELENQMKHLIFFAFILLVSCQKENIVYEISPEHFGESANTIYANAKIKLVKNAGFGLSGQYEILTGDKLVFEYIYVKEDNPAIADDEFTEILLFEIPENTANMTFKNNEILKQNAFYRYYCYCIPPGEIKENHGTLKVNRLTENTYQVIADVEFVFSPSEGFENEIKSKVNFDKVFVKK
jgi:hypothetical protein